MLGGREILDGREGLGGREVLEVLEGRGICVKGGISMFIGESKTRAAVQGDTFSH